MQTFRNVTYRTYLFEMLRRAASMDVPVNISA